MEVLALVRRSPRKKEKVVTGDQEVNEWSQVSPAKVGRLSVYALQEGEVQISAFKFSVLSVDDEEEEGETATKNRQSVEVEVSMLNEKVGMSEGEQEEDDSFEQQVREEVKAGKKRGWKAKAPDENPGNSTRPSRRKH